MAGKKHLGKPPDFPTWDLRKPLEKPAIVVLSSVLPPEKGILTGPGFSVIYRNANISSGLWLYKGNKNM
jgi:hypothetical protein